jgi:histidinol dehydrogenase
VDADTISRSVADIISSVRDRGDEALIEFTRRWDGAELRPETLRVAARAIECADLGSDFASSFESAVNRIRAFHASVKPRSVTVEDAEGARLGIRWTPIDSVGLYVPGGKATYPSTLAMTAIPAQIAGVDRIVVVSPPGPDGEVSPQVLMAARILGIDEIYRVGGAQGVAALALGTSTVPRVDKIFGPGNAFVAEAKKQLFGDVGIDMLAGPSEVVVVADGSARADWVAADLMAQAEHDEATCATLLATSPAILEAVRQAIAMLLGSASRREIIKKSLDANGKFVVVESLEEAARRINEIAPEHLSIQVEDPEAFLPLVRNAGAIFLGSHSPVAVGDYYAGTNHVLPTGRTARFTSCLSVEDFMKRSNVCRTSSAFLRKHGENVEVLAKGEDLPLHGASIALRRNADAATDNGSLPITATPSGARPAFDSVAAYHLVEESADVKLNQNESPWDVPGEIKEQILEQMSSLAWNRYHRQVPDELCEAIGASFGLDAGAVFLGNGSNLILQWLFEAFGGLGRHAVLPAPSFSLFRMWSLLTETPFEEFRLEERGDSFVFRTDQALDAIRRLRPKLTVLNLPNNPTGSELPEDEFLAIVDETEQAGGWVVVDEAYQEFSDADYDRVELVRQGRPVFVVRTYSKAFAAAGIRIGYLLAPDAGRETMLKIVPPFHTSLFNAVSGLALWKNRSLFDDRIEQLGAERARMMAFLREISGIRVYDTSANFFVFRLGKDLPVSADQLHSRLSDASILTRKLPNDPLLDNCLRVNVGISEENDRFLAEVTSILGS